MGQIERVPDFVTSGPKQHAIDPCRRLRIAGWRRGNERVDENCRALAMIGTNIIEHDPA